jgi:hypothetical protein
MSAWSSVAGLIRAKVFPLAPRAHLRLMVPFSEAVEPFCGFCDYHEALEKHPEPPK